MFEQTTAMNERTQKIQAMLALPKEQFIDALGTDYHEEIGRIAARLGMPTGATFRQIIDRARELKAAHDVYDDDIKALAKLGIRPGETVQAAVQRKQDQIVRDALARIEQRERVYGSHIVRPHTTERQSPMNYASNDSRRTALLREGIDVPPDETLAFLRMSFDEYEATQRKMIKDGVLSGAPIRAQQTRADDHYEPSAEDLRISGLSREAFIKAERASRPLGYRPV